MHGNGKRRITFITCNRCLFVIYFLLKGGENMEEYKADFDNAKMAEEFIVDVEKAFEKLSEMGFEEFTQIS